MMALKLAIFGQAPVAVDCIDRLLAAGHEIAAVYAPEDGSRPDQLAARARELGLAVFQRRYFKKKTGEPIAAALADYEQLGVDLNVMASFTYFLPPEMTDAPTHGSICYHPSLLPRYRGGNALQWQIIDGEPEVGVSIFVPDTGVDTGQVVVQKGGVEIGPEDTIGTLFFNKLGPLGVDAMVEAVVAIDAGTAAPWTQDEAKATHQGLVSAADAAIDLSAAAAVVDRLIRGCDPQPGAHVKHGEQSLKLFDARLEAAVDGAAGSVAAIDDKGMVIALAGGSVRVGRVRGDAGKEPAAEYAARSGLAVGDQLGSG